MSFVPTLLLWKDESFSVMALNTMNDYSNQYLFMCF